ncbi:MAG: Xaa-Pro peptidase family protein [Spirochaetia bacterium]
MQPSEGGAGAPAATAAAAFRARQSRLAGWLSESGIHACVTEDFENQRSNTLRWLSGHPTDALLFTFASGRTVLVPWDVNLANARSAVDEIIPYTEFNRSFREAVIGVLKGGGPGMRRRVEFPARTSHLRFQELEADLPDMDIIVRARGFEDFVSRARTVKDAIELAATEKAAEITNALIESITAMLAAPRGAEGLREMDLAQLIQREALARGAEGLGFETLAAGPGRSWAIHPFPAFGSGPFGTPGLSILDFGVKVDGYTSDVTLTVVRGKPSAEQARMVALVEQGYAAALAAMKPGVPTRSPAAAVDELFAAAGVRMPHALGHGIGLDTHEAPLIRGQGETAEAMLQPGMIVTVEPGLYHPDHGGVRWENDVLITETGNRVLTRAAIIRLP